MNRIGLRIVALILTAGLLLAPALIAMIPDDSTTSPDPVTITDHHARFLVQSHGKLIAKETLTTEFPAGRHGIFRGASSSGNNDAFSGFESSLSSSISAYAASQPSSSSSGGDGGGGGGSW
ncbi:hypothetical protein [Aeromicrobium sp.]|uniref:hypothetical protein n=1 Tax=Aeromicrobium sp. TaxID=1871063 RepID=UPI001995DA19|nr:hypothetical protein [Aeromicrobium sp.]MBC7633211.1 hypothetical protein [Aeromicrobium sp.]